MRVIPRRRLLGATLAALVAGVVGVSVVRADSTPNLVAVDPGDLLASTLRAAATPPTVAGVVRTHVDLGLPELPELTAGAAPGDAAAAASMLFGDQTFRIWRSAAGIRVAHIARFGERVLVVNRSEAWAWDSQTMRAVRLTASDLADALHERARPAGAGDASRLPSTVGDPVRLASALLEAVRPYADVVVRTPEVVAGRDAYILELRPRSGRTLIGSILVAVDAHERIPLRLQVVPRGTVEPSIEVGFTSIDFGAIDPSLFAFAPPDGARVTDLGAALRRTAHEAAPIATPSELADARFFGSGFGLIAAIPVSDGLRRELGAVLPYAGPLGSAAIVARAGRDWLVAGAVPPGALSSVASRLP